MSITPLIYNPSKDIQRRMNIGLIFSSLFLILIILAVFTKSCNNSSNKYNLLHGARMGTGIIYDSTKPQEKTFAVSYTAEQWKAKLDTLGYASSFIGKSLTVDQADQLKTWFNSVISGIAQKVNMEIAKNPK